MTIKQDLMAEFPKGMMPPAGYVDWFEWAQSQHWHGLRQKKCRICGLYKFPQELHPACSSETVSGDPNG